MGSIEKDEISRQKLSHDISKRTSLKTHIKRGIVIFTVIKVIMGLQNIIFQKPTFENLANNFTLEDIYDDNKGEFTLLDQQQVKFTMEPNTGCVRGERFVVMALSAPNNEPKRETIRNYYEKYPDVKVVFMVGKVMDPSAQEKLVQEQLIHQDLIQISVLDAYYTLSYKTLGSFIWINRHCGGATYIMKIDDDVQANFDNVRASLDSRFPQVNENVIACNAIMRNMRPWRHNHTNTVMGKWSINKSKMSRRVYPDFCPGWLYVTTPKVGLGLAHVGKEYAEELKYVSVLDDIFVTGYLRERLHWVELEQLQPGISGNMFKNFFSSCPFLGIYKNVFHNDYVTKKGSGTVNYVNGKKFFFCAFLEYFILENLEYIHPKLTIPPIVEYCARKHF